LAPSCPAPQARLLWSAHCDASVLPVETVSARPRDADTFDIAQFRAWATIAAGLEGREHIALSDGYRRIRIDVMRGTLRDGPVYLRYQLGGLAGTEAKILTLRRLLAFCRLGRFARELHPPDRRAPRWMAALRVHDAIRRGVSQREIATVLYGEQSAALGRESGSDFLRLRVQRLVRVGRQMVSGGYLTLLR
jgi:hypothetical protein